ncbi:MAG TPA: hypothetical protein VES67_15430 [Vicinamibacterales bacterium]|nr:hypothetical protein [Vicinamibacterales bacterium]
MIARDTNGPLGLTPRQIAVRLFLTCWIVYALHFATNIVREIYPALAIGDHFSFRVDEYAHLHPDLFETEGRGWHINNNPGVSMLAAIPYTLARPVIDPIVRRAQRMRGSGAPPPAYASPWPMARDFYAETWRRGLDLKLGLAAFVMQAFCMAPSSALGVVVMFFVLRRLFGSDHHALWLAALYAFGTPVFFRTGYLNQNMMLGHIAFLGFVALWNPTQSPTWSTRTRSLLGGLAGGAAVLFDYSGTVLLLGLFLYAVLTRLRGGSARDAAVHTGWFVVGTLAPIGLLMFYQWQSFGHPLYPGQHWMPPVAWIDHGYRGMSPPQPDLLIALAFDRRYGLFVSCPLFLLALAAPFVNRGASRRLPGFELAALLGCVGLLWLFCGGVNYARLQFNTGIKHLAPIFPFLFVPVAIVLTRLPRSGRYFVAVLAVAQAWCLAMYRDVEIGPLGVLDSVAQVFLGGFQLPALTTLSRMGGGVSAYFPNGVSPLPLFVLVAAGLYGIWMAPRPGTPE